MEDLKSVNTFAIVFEPFSISFLFLKIKTMKNIVSRWRFSYLLLITLGASAMSINTLKVGNGYNAEMIKHLIISCLQKNEHIVKLLQIMLVSPDTSYQNSEIAQLYFQKYSGENPEQMTILKITSNQK